MSEDERRDRHATDEGQDEGEDVEGHRHAASDESKTEGESDDVEAHRQHGGVGRQHGGA
jgi:hypothetical protein